MLIKSTVFNFLYTFQLIQKVLQSKFLSLVFGQAHQSFGAWSWNNHIMSMVLGQSH